jgi:hypothetical protein
MGAVRLRWCTLAGVHRVSRTRSIEQDPKWGDKMHEDLDAAASLNFLVGRRPLYY